MFGCRVALEKGKPLLWVCPEATKEASLLEGAKLHGNLEVPFSLRWVDGFVSSDVTMCVHHPQFMPNKLGTFLVWASLVGGLVLDDFPTPASAQFQAVRMKMQCGTIVDADTRVLISPQYRQHLNRMTERLKEDAPEDLHLYVLCQAKTDEYPTVWPVL